MIQADGSTFNGVTSSEYSNASSVPRFVRQLTQCDAKMRTRSRLRYVTLNAEDFETGLNRLREVSDA